MKHRIAAQELTVDTPRELTETEWDAISGGAAAAGATNTGTEAVAVASDTNCVATTNNITIGAVGGNCAGAATF